MDEWIHRNRDCFEGPKHPRLIAGGAHKRSAVGGMSEAKSREAISIPMNLSYYHPYARVKKETTSYRNVISPVLQSIDSTIARDSSLQPFSRILFPPS